MSYCIVRVHGHRSRVRVRFQALPDFVSTVELLERKSSGSGLENRDYVRRGSCRADHAAPLYPHKIELTSPACGGRSVGIVRSRTQATEFFYYLGRIGRFICPNVWSNIKTFPLGNTGPWAHIALWMYPERLTFDWSRDLKAKEGNVLIGEEVASLCACPVGLMHTERQ
jgi:hypothetical protein